MKIVKVDPGEKAYSKEIDGSLASLQAEVGGLIEAVYPFSESVALVCNEEGKLNGSEPNRAVFSEDGFLLDVIHGPFFICGIEGDSFSSLTQEQIEKYIDIFNDSFIFISE